MIDRTAPEYGMPNQHGDACPDNCDAYVAPTVPEPTFIGGAYHGRDFTTLSAAEQVECLALRVNAPVEVSYVHATDPYEPPWTVTVGSDGWGGYSMDEALTFAFTELCAKTTERT